MYIHVNHLLLSDIKNWKKRFGTFLGTTSLRSVQSVVSRRHSTVVKNDATKKWMRRITCYFTQIFLALFQ